MLRLGAECGLRRGEIARVHSDDVMDDLLGRSLVVRGKGDKQRIVPLPDDLADEINSRYLTTFQCRPDPEHTCLRFCTSWITNEEAVADFVENFKDMVIKYQ